MSKMVVGYLIERYINSHLHYWNGKYIDAAGWTTQADQAIRFCRAQDAATVLGWTLKGEGRVVEHSWVTD